MNQRFKAHLLALLALALAVPGWPEPKQLTVNATQTSDTWSLPSSVRSVVVHSNTGNDTCRFRLFTNRDTQGAATMADPSIEIFAGESLEFSIRRSTTEIGGDTEAGASGYTAISAICGSGDTGTLRVFYK